MKLKTGNWNVTRFVLPFVLFIFAALCILHFSFRFLLTSKLTHYTIKQATENHLKASGDFLPLYLDNGALCSQGLSMKGRSESMINKLSATQIKIFFKKLELLNDPIQIKKLSIDQMDVRLKKPGTKSPPEKQSRKLTINEIYFSSARLDISETVGFPLLLESNSFYIHWMQRFYQKKNGQAIIADLPTMDLTEFYGYFENETLHIERLRGRGKEAFGLELAGTIKPPHNVDLKLTYREIPLRKIFPAIEKLPDVIVSGEANIKTGIEISGHLSIDQALHLNFPNIPNHPLLSGLTTFTHATTKYQWKKNQTQFTQLDLENPGKIAIQGTCKINNGQLNGTVKLGISPNILKHFPGAQDVFNIRQKAYFWTPVLLSGTLENPKENLSPRLITSAIKTIPETLQKSLFETLDLPLKILPKHGL